MFTITIELTEAEHKALAYVASSPEDWAVNAVKERCRVAMEEIFQQEVQRMLQDPTIKEIPADRETVVLAADAPSAADRDKALLERLKNGPIAPDGHNVVMGSQELANNGQ